MNTLKILLAEIGYRKLNFLLSLFAVMIAVMLFVAGPVLIDAYGRQTQQQLAELEDKTRQYMRDMGFNLRIVHRDNDMIDFWSEDFVRWTMPQEYIDRLAHDQRLTKVTHLVATLQKKIDWQDRKVLLIGYLPETPQPHRAVTKFAKGRELAMQKRLPMGENIQPGTVCLGHELGAGKQVGETVDVLGKRFELARIAPESGSKEDIALKMHLADAQALLNLPGQINQIMALECRCQEGDLPVIRQQLEQILPEAKVTEFQSIALARAKQREEVKVSRETQQHRVELLALIITPLVVGACAVWIGLLTLANVRERRTEIGILRAIGKGSGTIAGLFLGKAVLLGVVGAAVGFVLGSVLARWLGIWVLEVPAGQFTVHYDVLLVALLGAPLLAAVASYLPTLAALMQDPAAVLRDH
ncbi:MAG: FtsX-like permease family protein [Pirellulales bacterium]|nr:FtsX-like permease family protein [Pirellulales bacterium]